MKLRVALVVAVLVGTLVGVGVYTFGYGKGLSYFSTNPAACANCHVMNDYYAGWMKGPHRSVAVCNDCHAPHDFIGKYSTKASNGFWHSFYFTTGRFHEPIQITPGNREVTEKACRKCHAAIVAAIDPMPGHRPSDKTSCIRCHSTVGHMR